MREIMDQFEVVTDDGRKFTVRQCADFYLSGDSRSGGHSPEHGLHYEYVTADGHPVNKLADGRFEIEALGVIGSRVGE